MERITISSRVDAKIFKDFAYFDILKRQKKWRSPAVFAALMMISALVCFSQSGVRQGAVMLGTVLTAIALIVPFSYFFTFNSSLNKQVVRQGIARPRVIYNIELNDKGVEVSNETEKAHFDWESLYQVYYRNNCVYLYVAATRAFLLPEAEIKCGFDTLWQFLEEHIPAEKLFK